MSPQRVRRAAMTLIELLVVVSIVLVLAGMLVPAVGIIRTKAKVANAQSTVSALHQALQNYAAADSRHRYPPMVAASDFTLRWDQTSNATANLNMLATADWNPDLAAMDRSTVPWTFLDPFGNPYQYKVDDNLLGLVGAQRPLTLPAWNTAGKRPWAYVWSTGKNRSADGNGWVYQMDAQ